MEPLHANGLAGLVAQTDAVGMLVIVTLVAMSGITWYLIITRAISRVSQRRRSERFVGAFWDAPSLQAVSARLDAHAPDDPFSRLAQRALAASRHHQRHAANRLHDAGGASEFVQRALRRQLDEEQAHLESGLTMLASVGSTAPFVGLFGTVWGVYHALVAIGLSGQGTLDKVAGPVGEALIMTAAGLVVAIPAVLAYNAFVRRNRLVLGELDGFAHDLHAFLTTGSHVGVPAPAVPLKAVVATSGA